MVEDEEAVFERSLYDLVGEESEELASELDNIWSCSNG